MGLAMSKNKIVAFASPRALDNVESRKLLIGGQLVFASMSANAVPPSKNYFAQTPREAVGGLFSGLQKRNPKVYVHVHPSVLDMPKARYGFTIDAYLAWGIKQRKGQFALIGGIEREDGEFLVDVLVFDAGQLIELYDQELPERSSVRFQAAAQSVIDGVKRKYPKAHVAQAAPLGDWGIPNVEYIGDKPLKRLSYRPLAKTVDSRRELLVPAAIVLAGVAFNVGAIGMAWNKYSEAQVRYENAASDPNIKMQGGIDSNYINVMTQRRLFMETPRRQDVLPSKVLDIVRGVGVLPGVQIVEMKLPAPSISLQEASGIVVISEAKKNSDLLTDDRVPDAWLRISVPRSAGSALEQAQQVVETLRGSTGMSLRLVHRGWQDENTRRIFTIEGFIHG